MGEVEPIPVVLEKGEKEVRRVDGVKLVSKHFSARGSLLLTDRRLIFIYRGEVEMGGTTIPEATVREAYKSFAPIEWPLGNIIDVKKPFLKKELVLVVNISHGIGLEWRAQYHELRPHKLLFLFEYAFTEIDQPEALRSEIMGQVERYKESQPPKVEKCPSCGAEIPVEATFCPACGGRVR